MITTKDIGIWKFCVWAAGIGQSVAYPPGWAREFFWDASVDSDGVFLENEVTNY
jgi:hypothetical protein